MALTAGSRIGPYEIQSALGAGGMGEVYRARDTRLDRMVAIKVLSPCITTDPAFLEPDPGLYVKAVDTGPERLLLRIDRGGMTPRDWSRNGFILAERRQRSAGIFRVPSSGDAGPTRFLDDDSLGEYTPAFSPPDGRWVAYQSDETGRLEVHVRRFDGSGRPVPISGGTGGSEPRWRADGKELFYLTRGPDTRMMAVDIIRAGETFEAGTPRRLFPVSLATESNETRYAVRSDGQRFLVVQPVGGNDPLPLTVVTNWAGRLKR